MKNELNTSNIENVDKQVDKASNGFNPDARIDNNELKTVDDSKQSFDPDQRIENANNDLSDVKMNENPQKTGTTENVADYLSDSINREVTTSSEVKTPENVDKEYYSDEKTRFDNTPIEGPRGEWDGEKGNSEYKPDLDDENGYAAYEALNEVGQEGIKYKDGFPDFSPVAEETVTIDNMTDKRYGAGKNFDQADEKCAEKWNNEQKDGRTDWTARDVKEYRTEKKLSWHECEDLKTCQLVPAAIHSFFGHVGGVYEYSCKNKIENSSDGDFDE